MGDVASPRCRNHQVMRAGHRAAAAPAIAKVVFVRIRLEAHFTRAPRPDVARQAGVRAAALAGPVLAARALALLPILLLVANAPPHAEAVVVGLKLVRSVEHGTTRK